MSGPIVILDVDGTLVDTNYHHAIAWYRAFRRFDTTLPLARLHRHMGMGGDQLVSEVAGEGFERQHGDGVRDAETEEYSALIGEVAALEHATELVRELGERGCRVILASSAKEEEIRHYVDLLGVDDVPYTSSKDAEQTKPHPDLVVAALEKAGGDGDAVMLGDTTWDGEAAQRAGVPMLGVLLGGFSELELREAGAREVFSALDELAGDLDTLLDAAAPIRA
ncbi:MAG: HAD family hydrolase [Solirubrobacteraceae bacterium]